MNILRIDLDRIIRVEDNGKPNTKLPHIKTHVNMNMYRNFPLYNVAEFEDVLPKNIVEKGGMFLPMYRKCHSKCQCNFSSNRER